MVSSRAGKWSESPSRDYVIDNAAQHLKFNWESQPQPLTQYHSDQIHAEF